MKFGLVLVDLLSQQDKYGEMAQVDCSQIKLLYYDTLSLSVGLDLCSAQPSVTIEFTEQQEHLNFNETFKAGEPQDYPIPGTHAGYPHLAEGEVNLDVRTCRPTGLPQPDDRIF